MIVKTYAQIIQQDTDIPRYFLGTFRKDTFDKELDAWYAPLQGEMEKALKSGKDIPFLAQKTRKNGSDWIYPSGYSKISNEVLHIFDNNVLKTFNNKYLNVWKIADKSAKLNFNENTEWVLVEDEQERNRKLRSVLRQRKESLIKQEYDMLKPAAAVQNAGNNNKRARTEMDAAAMEAAANGDDEWWLKKTGHDESVAMENTLEKRGAELTSSRKDLPAKLAEELKSVVKENFQVAEQNICQGIDEAHRQVSVKAENDDETAPVDGGKTFHVATLDLAKTPADNKPHFDIPLVHPSEIGVIEEDRQDEEHGTDNEEYDLEQQENVLGEKKRSKALLLILVLAVVTILSMIAIVVALKLVREDDSPTGTPTAAPTTSNLPSYSPTAFSRASPLRCVDGSYWSLESVTPGIPVEECIIEGPSIRSHQGAGERGNVFSSSVSTEICTFRVCPGVKGFVSASLASGSQQNTLYLSSTNRYYNGTASVVSPLVAGDVVVWTKASHMRDIGFELRIDQFHQIGKDIDGEVAHDWLGHATAMNGNGTIIAIGAPYNDDGGWRTGHVRVLRWNGENWEKMGNNIVGLFVEDESGYSVAMSESGTTLVVGARNHTSDDSIRRGNARVFQFDDMQQTWIQIGDPILGENKGDEFGWAVAMSKDGSTIAVGGRYSNGNQLKTGQVRVFYFNGSDWIKLGSTLVGEFSDDQFGYSVALSDDGRILACSAPYSHSGGNGRGLVQTFKYDDIQEQWNQVGQDITGDDLDFLGTSVSLSQDGTILAAGAQYSTNTNGQDAGQIRIYKFELDKWSLMGSPLNGRASYDNFGYSVSLNANGTVVAGGARRNDDNGDGSGHAQIYQYDGIQWNHLTDFVGESAGDQCGSSVALSRNGAVVAVGARTHSGIPGDKTGQVRVFAADTLR